MTTFVNEARVITRIMPRLFSGDVWEVLGELYQNSQRAGASRVELNVGEGSFTYADDGHGLRSIEEWRQLLSVGDTGYDEPVAAAQDPLGLGVYSLLVLPGVARVVFRSGDRALSVDCRRWLGRSPAPDGAGVQLDEAGAAAYRATWLERLATGLPVQAGLRVEAVVSPAVAEAILAACRADVRHHLGARHYPPHMGYAGLLAITCNEAPLPVGLPDGAAGAGHPAAREDRFEGNVMRLWPRDAEQMLGVITVNWYGQVLQQVVPAPCQAYLEVRQGRPLDLQAPTRQAIVKNERWTRFLQALEELAFASWRAHPAAPASAVRMLWRWNAERARRECRWIVVRVVRWQDYRLADDLTGLPPAQAEPHVIPRSSLAALTPLDWSVSFADSPPGGSAVEPWSFGVGSLVRCLPIRDQVVTVDHPGIAVATVQWRVLWAELGMPGGPAVGVAPQAGEWRLVDEGGAPWPGSHGAWQPAPEPDRPIVVWAWPALDLCSIQAIVVHPDELLGAMERIDLQELWCDRDHEDADAGTDACFAADFGAFLNHARRRAGAMVIVERAWVSDLREALATEARIVQVSVEYDPQRPTRPARLRVVLDDGQQPVVGLD